MAESTRLKASSDRLEDGLVKLTANHLSLSESIQTMTLKLDELIHNLVTKNSITSSPSASSIVLPSFASSVHAHCLKLEVPCFDGSDALCWIFKINQFFEYHSTLEHERLTIASFYMDGSALPWFQWTTNNG